MPDSVGPHNPDAVDQQRSPGSSAEQEPPKGLERGLSIPAVVTLAISDITPMASLFIIAPVVLSLAGTAALWAYVVGFFLAINVAYCMGELGSMYPVAGGMYSVIHRVLGRLPGFLALLLYLAEGVFIPASIALGIGTYLHAINPVFSVGVTSAVAMALVTLLAVLRIQTNAFVVALFLAIEVAVIGLLAAVGFANWNQPLSILTDPVVFQGGTLQAVTVGAVVAALASTMFSVNGYDSAINFSEETRGRRKDIGRAVVIAAVAAVILEFLPFLGGLFGAQNLGEFLASPTPFTGLVETVWGTAFANAIIVGALFAVVNAVLAITLQFSRILWSSARDRAWPQPVNDALGRVHPRFSSPWVATLIIGGIATVLCLVSDLVTTVTFTALLIIIMYALVAVAALVSRARDRNASRPFRMPMWPVPPLLVLGGIVIAISQQTVRDILIVAGIFVVGVIYYYLYLHRAKHDRWVPHEHDADLDT